MNDPKSTDQIFKEFLRETMVRGTIAATIFLLIQATIWGVLNFLLPAGWVQAVVNILFFLFALSTSIGIKKALDIGRVPGCLGLLVGVVILVLVIGVFRPIVTEILAAIF